MTATTIAATWWQWMGAMLWQSTLLILAIAVADRALRGRIWPELLHGLWLLVPVKLLVPPALPSPWRAPSAGDAAAAAAETQAPGFLLAGLAIWCAGAVAWSTVAWVRQRRFAIRVLAASRPCGPRVAAARARAAARLGWQHPVVVRELGAVAGEAGALVVGCRRPIVYLPATWAERLGDDALEHVLLHELAHIRRRDLWIELWFAVLQGVYWFHPLVAYARRRCRGARELACDATVARSLADTVRYRATLLELGLGGPPGSPRGLAASAGLLGQRNLLLARIDALERAPSAGKRPRRVATAAVLVAVALGGLPLAAPADHAAKPGQELDRARADLEALAGRDDVGSLHLRWAVARVNALEERQNGSAAPP
jgi:beta-lactamase regulating signal transducer with metallopeptidase domain